MAQAIQDTYALGNRALNYVKNKTELWRETCSYMEASIPFPQSLTEPGEQKVSMYKVSVSPTRHLPFVEHSTQQDQSTNSFQMHMEYYQHWIYSWP